MAFLGLASSIFGPEVDIQTHPAEELGLKTIWGNLEKYMQTHSAALLDWGVF